MKNSVSPLLRPTVGSLVLLLLGTAVSLSSQPSQAAGSLTATSLINRMVEAHGGMEAWSEAPSVHFVEQWIFPGQAPAPATRVIVEQGPRRAILEGVETSSLVVWDGERAWSVDYAGQAPPRFLALLNYHFANLPWLAKDPGVILGEPETAKLWNDPVEYRTIKITYESGVGDTPRDYYRLYLHPETGRLHATEYIVTYKALLPPGVESTPPHILVYDDWTEVDGLLVPAHFTIRNLDESVYAECAFSDWAFDEAFDAERMTMPKGAVVDESEP